MSFGNRLQNAAGSGNYSGGNVRGKMIGEITSNPTFKKAHGSTGHGAVDRVNPMLKQDQASRKKGRDDAAINEQVQGVEKASNAKLDSADSSYKNTMQDLVNQYESGQKVDLGAYVEQLKGLSDGAKNQATGTEETYTNTITPALTGVLGKHKTNADSAMTLEQSQDPNNPMAQQVRALYDNLGQQERQRGQQDYGVLAAMGAQAAGQQFGQMPMTSGKQGQIYGQNQAQAGNAYARAQQRMYDLQQQGVDRGFDETKHWYGEGQKSIDKYGNAAKDIQNASTAHGQTMTGLRDEQGKYGGDIFKSQTGFRENMSTLNAGIASTEKGNSYAGTTRDTTTGLNKLGRDQEGVDAQYERDMEKNRANAVLLGKSLEGAGTMGGFATGMFAGGGMAGSDKRIKNKVGNIKSSQLKEFFSAVKPKKYQYKNPNTSITRPGQRYGFMLQDVAKTKLGKEITRKMPDGTLAYDKDNLQGILVAALSDSYRGKMKTGRKKGS